MRKWAVGSIVALFLAAGWVATGQGPDAWAFQVEEPGPPTEVARPNDAVSKVAIGQTSFVPAERSMLLLLNRAQRLLDESRHGEAAQCLGVILESPDDFFFRPDASSPIHRSLKAEARRMIERMPRKGRELYELEFGSVARRMLDEAVTAGNVDALAEVSRRFFHTRAGTEATLLLGFHHLDHGRQMAGALTFKRLWESSLNVDQYEPALSLALAACWLQAAEPEKARRVLEDLQSNHPGLSVQIAGEEVPLDSREDGLVSWLADVICPAPVSDVLQTGPWPMLRGSASRNAAGGGGGPLLTMRWRVPTTDYPEVESLIEGLRRDYLQEDVQLIPAFHPLVVDDVLLMRTVTKLQAVDFKTGKRIWEAQAEDPFDGALDSAGNVASQRKVPLETTLRLRMWGDVAFGTLSSDGKHVFSVEGLKLEDGTANRRQFVVNPRRPAGVASTEPCNRLAAHEIRTGKLMWLAGGATNEQELPLGGAFFLGPPLPLMGDLYVLAELRGEIRLLALDSDSGNLLWDQQLTVVSRDLRNDLVRRLAGASPSYADGILVCPTSDKSVVALELTTRSLLWGYVHSTSDPQPRRQGMFIAPGQLSTANSESLWIDSSVVLAEGRVLITPVKSDEIHCLDLADGRLVWKRPRNDDLYVGCVHHGKVVLVGKRGVRTLALKDGSAAWKSTVEFPQGSSLTGTGFRGGNRYYIPLDTATVVAIDLDAGRLVETFESREQAVPGNLVCHKDKMVSQRADGVEVFHQLDLLREEVAKRLAAKPDDTEALTWAGEIKWNDGNLEEAVESFRAAWKLSPSIYSRRALREALFEGLREEFETYRGRLDEIHPLIDEVAQQATLLRLVAMGLEDAGEYEGALDHYRELIELDDDRRQMEPIDRGLALRQDRWIRVQMSALREKMPQESRDRIDRFARDLLDAAISKQTPEAMRGFLEYFDGQPIAREARDVLAGLLKQNGRPLELELLLARDAGSSDPERAGRAVAETATVLAGAKRWEDASVCYRRLVEDFSNVICRDGKTGKELYEAVESDGPVSPWLTPGSAWPVGNVELREGVPKPARATSYGNMVVNYQGGSGAYFRDLAIEIHQTPLQLVARDGLGMIRWRLPMDTIIPREHLAHGRATIRVNVLGHMLLLSMGNKILAIDALEVSNGQTPRVVWSQELQMPDTVDIRRQRFRRQLANMPGGLGRFGIGGSLNPTSNGAVAVSLEAVCFKRFRGLVAVDPTSGEEIWMRRDVHPDSLVFGDHKYVLVVGPDKTEADVFRVADGKLLSRRTVPAETERIATIGRRILAWREEGDGAILELVDPLEEKTPKHSVWVSGALDGGSRLFILEDEAVAVYEPNGHFIMLDLVDGHPIVDQQLQPEKALVEIFVLRSPEQYLLIAHSRQLAATKARRTYMHGVSSVRIGRGRVHAFDLAGEKIWTEPVEVTNQFLALNQPRRLPVLTFVCMVQEPQASNKVRTQPKTAILCLDKRTGRVVCSRELADPTSVFQLSGDREKKTVGIRLQKSKLTLTFTDQPIPPEEDSDEGGESSEQEDSSAAKTLLGAVKKALLGLADDEPSHADEPEGGGVEKSNE